MTPLDRAVQFLRAHGLRAERRRWQLGDTVVATPAHGDIAPSGIEVFGAALYIVCSDGTWEVVDYARSGSAEVRACDSMMTACEFVIVQLALPPDLDALLDCARRVASAAGLPCPPDLALRDTIERVLVERNATRAEISGLITRTEAKNLLLAHLETLICENAGVAIRAISVPQEVQEAMELAWFGAVCEGAG